MFLLKPKNILKILCHSILVFSIILILLINSFPWFLNISYLQNKFFQTVTNQTQVNINSDDIDFDLFPAPAIRFKNITINSNNNITYKIQAFLLYFDLKELLKKNPVLTKIVISNSKLNFDLSNNTPSNLSVNTSPTISNITNFLGKDNVNGFIDKKKDLTIFINNFQYDFAEKLDAIIKINSNNTITGNLSIINFALNKELMKKHKFNENIFNLNSQANDNLIQIENLKTDFKITDNRIQIVVPSTDFQYPSMTLGLKFIHDKKSDKAKIGFFGQNVNIDQAKKAYFSIFNKEEVSENLFDIVRSGTAPKITVLFKEKKLKDMLRPGNMILTGQLENGDIKIPNTQLIPKKVFGSALIKKGILYINAEKGKLKNSVIKKGTLEIDLLNSVDYPFHGSFKIHAPLEDIRNVLIESFPGTLLNKELRLVRDVKGGVDGELHLELQSGKDLVVTVVIDEVIGSGVYLRAPGGIKINMGKFLYKNNIVTLTDFAGKVGESYFYDFTGTYTLDDSRFLDISSGKSLIDSKEVFTWLVGFESIKKIVPDLAVNKGYLRIDSLMVNGDILKPGEFVFHSTGFFKENFFAQNIAGIDDESNGILLSSCNFNISDKELSVDKINAIVSNINVLTNFTDNKEIENLSTPFALTDLSYKSKTKIVSLTGSLIFLNGPQINFSSKKNNNDKFFLNKLKLKDNSITNATFCRDKKGNTDFYKFKGQIDTKTFEKIFKNNSDVYKDITGYTDKKKIIIKSKGNSTYSLSAKTINLEPFLTNLFSKNKQRLFSENKNTDTFPNKIFTLNADSVIYKKSIFNQFKADMTIKKTSEGLNGKFNFKSKDGKVDSLTLLSRILAVINVSTLFKGKLPDVKQEGFEYNSIHFKTDIVNNKIILNEAVIDGHDMALVFKGTIDPVKNDLNLTCLVAPFKTIDMLIEKIPLISTMLNNNLISIPVKVSGKINDPKVIPMHPVSVGKGLVNLMTNIIKTPVKLWQKLPKKDKSE